MALRCSKAEENDIASIIEVSENVWKQHYASIISQEQINYMYPRMYSYEAIHEQMRNAHQFYIIVDNKKPLGFISMQLDTDCIHIPKLYVAIPAQGRGIGRMLIEQAKKVAQAQGVQKIRLNVNRFNTNSIAFYKKVGFSIIQDIDIPLDRFVLEDHIMELQVS